MRTTNRMVPMGISYDECGPCGKSALARRCCMAQDTPDPGARPCAGFESITIDAAVDQAHAVAHAQVIHAVLGHGAHFAVVHADVQLVHLGAVGIAVGFDIVAQCRAAHCASDGGGGTAAAAADLVTHQRADQAADDGAGAAGAARAAHDLDRIDGAVARSDVVVVAVVVAGIVVAIVVGGRGGRGATGQQGSAGNQNGGNGVGGFHVSLLTNV